MHTRTVTSTRLLFEGGASDKLLEAHQILFTENDVGVRTRKIIDLLVRLPERKIWNDDNRREPNPDTKHALAILRATLQSFDNHEYENRFLDLLDFESVEEKEFPWRETCLNSLKATAGLCVLVHRTADREDTFINYASLLARGENLTLAELAKYWQIEREKVAEFLSKSVAEAIKEPQKKIAFQILATLRYLRERWPALKIQSNFLGVLIREVNFKLLNSMSANEQLGHAISHLTAMYPESEKQKV